MIAKVINVQKRDFVMQLPYNDGLSFPISRQNRELLCDDSVEVSMTDYRNLTIYSQLGSMIELGFMEFSRTQTPSTKSTIVYGALHVLKEEQILRYFLSDENLSAEDECSHCEKRFVHGEIRVKVKVYIYMYATDVTRVYPQEGIK